MDYSRRIKQAGVCISSSRYDAGELIEGFVPALLSPAVVRARRDADMAQGELADRRRKAFRPPPSFMRSGSGHAFQTRSRGASKMRVMMSSISLAGLFLLATSSSIRRLTSLLLAARVRKPHRSDL